MGIKYATRERVQLSLEAADTSRSAMLIDQKLEAASRQAEACLHRRFYPELRTITFDWPNYQYVAPYQLWLGANELISISTMTSGGTAIAAPDRLLRRGDNKAEPPYSYIEIDQASSASFQSGDTFQQAISILGLTGWNDTDTTQAASGSLDGAIDSSEGTLTINPASGDYSALGVWSLLLVGSERMEVIAKRYSDTTINTTAVLDDQQSDTAVPVGDGTAFAVGEVILIDSERMRIDDIAGNTLLVQRAYDGSTLAEHASGEDVFAKRTFMVRRGILGSTAASHSDADPVYVHQYPEPLPEWVVAMTEGLMNVDVREGMGDYLKELESRAYYALGRTMRLGAI